MTNRLLLGFLALTVLVLAVLEIPLGITYARNERQDLTLKVERDAVTLATLAEDVLEPGGAFVCKVFQGGTERELLERLKRAFAAVRHIKPPASRAESAELYVVATGFRG